MKKYLPTSTGSTTLTTGMFSVNKGFTLIEILVVVTIIAVLAVIAFAVFSGIGGQGNDARRQADIKALADAMEVKYTTAKTYGTQTIAGADFGGGVFPKEPSARTAGKYCFSEGTAAIANPGTWASGACPSGWGNLDTSTSLVTASTTTNWRFCTLNQAGNGVICFGNRL